MLSNITTPTSSTSTHLICPSNTSEAHAAWCKFVPFRRWLNLTHSDTYIHGPFDFSAVNGRKMSDCISQSDWDVLATHSSMFHNPIPWFDLPSYSIHVDHGVHIAYCYAPNNTALRFIDNLGNDSLIPWQNVLVIALVCRPPPPSFGAAKRDLAGFAGMLATTSQTRRVNLCSNEVPAITVCDHHLLSLASLVLLAMWQCQWLRYPCQLLFGYIRRNA